MAEIDRKKREVDIKDVMKKLIEEVKSVEDAYNVNKRQLHEAMTKISVLEKNKTPEQLLEDNKILQKKVEMLSLENKKLITENKLLKAKQDILPGERAHTAITQAIPTASYLPKSNVNLKKQIVQPAKNPVPCKGINSTYNKSLLK